MKRIWSFASKGVAFIVTAHAAFLITATSVYANDNMNEGLENNIDNAVYFFKSAYCENSKKTNIANKLYKSMLRLSLYNIYSYSDYYFSENSSDFEREKECMYSGLVIEALMRDVDFYSSFSALDINNKDVFYGILSLSIRLGGVESCSEVVYSSSLCES